MSEATRVVDLERAALDADAARDLRTASRLYHDLLKESGVSAEANLNAAVLFYLGIIEPSNLVPIADSIEPKELRKMAERCLEKVTAEGAVIEAKFWRLYWDHLLIDEEVDKKMADLFRSADPEIKILWLYPRDPDSDDLKREAKRFLERFGPINSERKRYIYSILS